MIYNTKNSKNLLLKTLVLPLLFFMTAAKAYIYKVDLLVNEQTGQEIICLSDQHNYPAYWRNDPEKENIASVQQANIIAFAKTLKATVLIESLEALLIENLKEMNKIENERELRKLVEEKYNNKIETPLRLLYPLCFINNIPCENVECRVTLACLDPHTRTTRSQTPQEILTQAQKTAKKIAQFNDEKPFKKIYKKELDYFNSNLYPNLEQLVKKLDILSYVPINELAESIKNQEIPLPKDVSNIISYITVLEQPKLKRLRSSTAHLITAHLIETMNIFPIKFVDMNILHAIAQNKQKSIIVVAGGDHINNVVHQLQQCGYVVKKFIEENTKKPRKGYIIYPSALNLETEFNNLEQAKSNCVQKIENFFCHPWTKRIGCLALTAAGVYAATCWLSKQHPK